MAVQAGNGFVFTPLNIGFVLAALFFNTVSAPLVKLTQNGKGGYDYNKWSVYFFSEFFKLIFALGCCARSYVLGDQQIIRHLNVDLADFMQYAVPGFVFFVQNNLAFLALQHMTSAAFNLFLNTRIVTVALMSVTLLKKPLNTLEWTSVVLLTIGAVQYQLSSCTSYALKVDSFGLGVVAVIVMCAAVGNVYTQKVMQRKMDQPLMLQNAMLYVWGVLYNGLNWFFSVWNSDHGAPFFGKIGRIQVFSMFFYAAYGLSISIILKRFGAITRTFINTAAICFTALFDVMVFGDSISLLELTTFATIFIAVFLHSVLARNYFDVPLTTDSKV